MPRTTGYIVTYKQDRGYGFIDSPSYPEQRVFFHFTGILNYETSILRTQLNQATSDDIYPPIEVSFDPVRAAKGLEAFRIQPLDLERAQEAFYKIRQFLQTADLSPDDAENTFTKHVTLKIVSRFGQDLSLKSIVTKTLVKSSEKWDEIVTLAREWEDARTGLTKPAIWNSQSQLTRLSSHLISLLGLKPLKGSTAVEMDARVPMFLHRIQPLNTPFETLGGIKDWSFVFLPDNEVLADVLTSRPHFLSYDREKMKIIVLLSESPSTSVNDASIALLSQSDTMRLLLKSENDDIYRQGRMLRSILPKSMLQPYDASVPYSEKLFSGRAQERERILSSSQSSNFAIYGGRRIGKTWFLQDLVRKCQEPPHDSLYLPLYVSLQPARNSQQAINYIQEAISFRYGLESYQGAYTFVLLRNRFIKLHKEYGKSILLTLDEVDRLVRANDGREFFEELRSFQSTYPEIVKIVLAGFKDLMRSVIMLTDNYALGNWFRGNHFSLGCLTKDDLRNLVLRLRWVGVNFNADEILEKVYGLTSGHPYYSHTLCESIASAVVNQNIKSLSAFDVDKYVSAQFFTSVFQTFKKNLNPLQQLIGKIFTEHEGEVLGKDILHLLSDKYGISIAEEKLNDEMDILEACSVFARRKGGFIPVMHQINRAFFETLNDEDLALRVLVGENTENNKGADSDGE